MPKTRGESITYAAACADISRTSQINAQNIWHSTAVRGLAFFLYLYELAVAGLKRQTRQRLGEVWMTRLMRKRQINTRGLRYTLR